MSGKTELKRSIYNILNHNQDGSFNTKAGRKQILFQIAEELHAGGYNLRHVTGLKQKHVVYLNKHWREQELNPATIKNRNAKLRWLCEKLGKRDLMPSNDQLGVAKRKYVTNENKGLELKDIDLQKITNERVLVQLHLQRYLGLRREEAIKIKPHQADKGKYIELQASWCKGGRGRTVPVFSKEARYWLERAKNLADSPENSLIEAKKTYKSAKNLYDTQCRRAGIAHAHGLRHAFAQELYKTLTSWEPPCKGGPRKCDFTYEQRMLDYEARSKISSIIGHSRLSVVALYIGSASHTNNSSTQL